MLYNSLTPGGHLIFGDHVGALGLYEQLKLLEKVGFEDVDVAWRQNDCFVAGGRRNEDDGKQDDLVFVNQAGELTEAGQAVVDEFYNMFVTGLPHDPHLSFQGLKDAMDALNRATDEETLWWTFQGSGTRSEYGSDGIMAENFYSVIVDLQLNLGDIKSFVDSRQG